MGLKHKTIAGFIWTFSGTVGSGVISFMVTMILARALTPSDFGILELMIVFTSLSTVIVDSGFTQAIIRDNNASLIDLSTVFFFNIIVSVIIYLVLFFCAPIIANFFKTQELIYLTRFLFLSIILDSFAIIQNANLNRNLNFRPFAIASVSAIIIAGIVAVIMAFSGWGVWSLAWNIVLISGIRTLMLWIQSNWRPKLHFSLTSLKKYFVFGINLLFQGLIDKIVTNLESFLIGRFYTKQSLGYFSQARRFDAYISQTTTNVVQKVTYPSLSKLKDEPERLKNGYRRVIGLTMFCITPLMIFTMFTAENFISVIFGPKWIPSAEYLRVWAIWGFIFPISTISTNIFLVKGKSKLLLKLSLVKQLLRIIAVTSLISIGIIQMLYAIVFCGTVTTLLYMFFGGKLIDYKIREMLNDIKMSFSSTIISTICVWAITLTIPRTTNLYISFFIQITTMLFSYLILSKYFFKSIYSKEGIEIASSLILKIIPSNAHRHTKMYK